MFLLKLKHQLRQLLDLRFKTPFDFHLIPPLSTTSETIKVIKQYFNCKFYLGQLILSMYINLKILIAYI